MEMSKQQVQALVEQVMCQMAKSPRTDSSVANSQFNEVLGEGGCEPFDKEYGMMNFGDPTKTSPSPYDRTNRILHRVCGITEAADAERAMLYTEAHKKFGGNGGSQIITNAKILNYILDNITINVYPDELIVGEMGAPARCSPFFPEFSFDWIVDELNNSPWYNRKTDIFACSDETKVDLLSIADYWEGKNLKDHVVNNYLTQEEIKGSSLGGRPVYMPNLYVYGGVGHTCLDYETLLNEGYSGLKRMIIEQMEAIEDFTTPANLKKREFYTAALISLEAGSKFFRRYAACAREKAAAETNPEEKKILQQIAENCDWVSENKPKGYWDALQLYHLASNITLIESNGHSITYAGFDQVLYPFYEKDMKEGKITKSFVAQCMESFYIKIHELRKLRDEETATLNSEVGIGGPCLVVGGQKADGSDATNDLTYLAIEAHNHTCLPDPWFACQWNDAAPWEIKVKMVEAIKIGTGQPKLFNIDGIIPAELAKGISLEEARTCTMVGCVELDVPGKEYGAHDLCYFSLPKVMELALNGGQCIDCNPNCPRFSICNGVGKTLGPNTGSLATAKNIDELKESYRQQMKYWCDRMISCMNRVEEAHKDLKPIPFLSGMNKCAIENGMDLTAGGAKYNFSGPQGVGPATVGDSLINIQKIVFEDKKITGEQFLDCLRKDWKGYEEIYQLANSDRIPHFGNDDDDADAYAVFASECYFEFINGRENVRSGKYAAGLYSVSANVGIGMIQGATPDGRKAYEAVSNCIGAVNTEAGNHDINGPTAMCNSAAKYDHQKAGNGTLLNIRFTPNSVSGKEGTKNLIEFIHSYFHQYPQHIQFNIQNTETLKDAQLHPENYKGLLVRVAGYSAYFTRLSKALQDDLIHRNAFDEI
ncbi:pyruvate formate lyase family protein [Acetobacterium carbinolicum]|uniref:pyruvate formate lyase family protein n=1 Tax=Acetobacterium carbinolicum TaxID=52690 RepID=UPI0039C9C4C7